VFPRGSRFLRRRDISIIHARFQRYGSAGPASCEGYIRRAYAAKNQRGESDEDRSQTRLPGQRERFGDLYADRAVEPACILMPLRVQAHQHNSQQGARQEEEAQRGGQPSPWTPSVHIPHLARVFTL